MILHTKKKEKELSVCYNKYNIQLRRTKEKNDYEKLVCVCLFVHVIESIYIIYLYNISLCIR